MFGLHQEGSHMSGFNGQHMEWMTDEWCIVMTGAESSVALSPSAQQAKSKDTFNPLTHTRTQCTHTAHTHSTHTQHTHSEVLQVDHTLHSTRCLSFTLFTLLFWILSSPQLALCLHTPTQSHNIENILFFSRKQLCF